MSAWVATPCEPLEQGTAPANPSPTLSKDADLVVSRSAGIRHRALLKKIGMGCAFSPPPGKKIGLGTWRLRPSRTNRTWAGWVALLPLSIGLDIGGVGGAVPPKKKIITGSVALSPPPQKMYGLGMRYRTT